MLAPLIVRRALVSVLAALIGSAIVVLLVAARAGDGLRGSHPPAGVAMPDLSTIDGVLPAIPPPWTLRGAPVMVVVTCGRCVSGRAITRALAALDRERIPEHAQIHLIVLDGAPGELSTFPHDARIHRADGGAAAMVRRRFHVGASGVAFLYDPTLRWRATFHLGQLVPADVAHDLRQLDR